MWVKSPVYYIRTCSYSCSRHATLAILPDTIKTCSMGVLDLAVHLSWSSTGRSRQTSSAPRQRRRLRSVVARGHGRRRHRRSTNRLPFLAHQQHDTSVSVVFCQTEQTPVVEKKAAAEQTVAAEKKVAEEKAHPRSGGIRQVDAHAVPAGRRTFWCGCLRCCRR